MNAEGWYHDPFEKHQLRWFSDGTPTELVRDEDVEAHEAPPEPTWDGPLEMYLPDEPARDGGADLRRADSGESAVHYDASATSAVALEPEAATGLGFG